MSERFQTPGRPAGAGADADWPLWAHLVAGGVYPFWYLLTPEGAHDAWWGWAAVSVAFLTPVLAARRAPWMRRLMHGMFPAPWLCTLQVYVLAWLNDMHVFYTVGSVMAVLGVSAVVPSKHALAGYGVFVALLGVGFFAVDPDPVKAACWGGVLPVVCIAYQRLSMLETQQQLATDYRNDLELEVEARTRELSSVNRRLRDEMQERVRLEEELRVASKLEAVGRLAGGMAHEFNNLLTRIRLYGELALADVGSEHAVREDVDEIQKAGSQAADLTRQLLTFSREVRSESEVIDLNAAIESSGSMLQRLLGDDRELAVELADVALPIECDPRQIEQLLVNLTLNARDATEDGGRVAIRTESAGERVRLDFRDDGIGMDAETRSRAFDPFFTRKPASRGTGLGLSIVYGIVQQAGGQVRLRSEAGRGACFEIEWPRSGDALDAPAAPARARRTPGGSERVLLVEDQAELRRALERLLASLGYRVLTRSDAESALDVATRDDAPIDLLLSDVVMPGMSGIELAEKLRASQPDARILLISGHLDARSGEPPRLPPGVAFLRKPFEADDLMRKVREVLDAAPAA